MKQFVCVLLFLLSSTCISLQADEYSPAYLELTQTSAEDYDLLWKVPTLGYQRLKLAVNLPDDVRIIMPMRSTLVGSAFIERSSIQRSGGLEGAEIFIEGLVRLPIDVLVRIQRLDGSTEILRLSAATPSFIVRASPTTLDVAITYTGFGVEHIWEGVDHLLFVACLILIAGTGRRILITITGFTFAHSITLTMATLGIVRLPVPPIEATIALSIVFLAREIALQRRDTLTWRYPIAVSSSFGLLHGFGFASALADIGLPQIEIPAALLAFNLGVEIGQILFVALIIAMVWLISRLVCLFQGDLRENNNPLQWLSLIEKPMAYMVGGVTTIWTMERVAQFWS